MPNIINNIAVINSKIRNACAKVGIAKSSINLLVVSKTQTPKAVAEVFGCGHIDFAENKLQDAEAKISALSSAIKWHFIGRVQRNKVNKILKFFSAIHSVDSLELALDIDRKAGELNLVPEIFFQVNLGNEVSKTGFEAEQLFKEFPELLKLQNVKICGLMCIPPIGVTSENSRHWFKQLRNLRDSIELDFKIKLPYLSMGMSDDFEIAIEEGATHIRIGSAIFGPREP